MIVCFALAAISGCTIANPPDCTSPDAWPAGMAFTHLKNESLINKDTLDFKNTKLTRLTSEEIGKDLYRQVHLVRFPKISGEPIMAITVNEVSSQECSMSNVDVYVISRRLGDYSKHH